MQSMAIVGLGNPGLEYVDSRHNLGFWLLDKYAEKFNLKFERLTGFSCLVAKFIRSGKNIYLIKPMQFMNHSGRELQKIFSGFSVSGEEALVIHDELDLPLGAYKVSNRKGPGGHNGVSDIRQRLGYLPPRLRIGMSGVREPGTTLSEFVLSPFSTNEKEYLNKQLPLFIQSILHFIDLGLDKAMNLINLKPKIL
jgi:PTH1 family peptidyl-tRNA hydrolase